MHTKVKQMTLTRNFSTALALKSQDIAVSTRSYIIHFPPLTLKYNVGEE